MTNSGRVTSSYCNAGTCIAVQPRHDSVVISDTKQAEDDPGKVSISVSRGQWQALLATIYASKLTDGISGLRISHSLTACTFTSPGRKRLHFDRDEWDAFVAGVRAGEFTEEAMLASA